MTVTCHQSEGAANDVHLSLGELPTNAQILRTLSLSSRPLRVIIRYTRSQMASRTERIGAGQANRSTSATRTWIGALVLSLAALGIAVGALFLVAAAAFDSAPVAAPPAAQQIDHVPSLPTDVLRPGEAGVRPAETNVGAVHVAAPQALAPQLNAPTLQDDPRLAAAIKNVLGDSIDDYGIVVYRLSDGRGISHNADKVFYSASLFKLSTLYEVEVQHALGRLDFAQPVQFSEEDVAEDLGTLGSIPLSAEGTLPMEEALEAMITRSDNATAHALLRLVGNTSVDATLARLGAHQTSVNSIELPTTAHDMALVMRAVVLGTGVSPAARDAMRNLLLRQETRAGIPSSLPRNVLVGNKTGNWEDATHDVAFVEAQNGTYIIAVLSDHAWDWGPIAAVSEAVYDLMAAG